MPSLLSVQRTVPGESRPVLLSDRAAAADGSVPLEVVWRRALAAAHAEMPREWSDDRQHEAIEECAAELAMRELVNARATHGGSAIEADRATFLRLRWRAADWIAARRTADGRRAYLPG